MAAKTVTDASFSADVLDSGDIVLIDFWAEWCGPCKQIAPALDEIAKDYEGKLTVAKVNIDENPETPGRYGVRGIPTLMIFSGGEHIATRVGAAPKSQLAAWVEEVMKQTAA
ncbi:thioredoxin TrxA [Hyphococcus sp.]|uniref:thioredoxin TrxA n=1 Tax=Hyphococcus sp. TaxID=2038636 RepID=UPI00208D1194|nr:MAG: thioredoxin [Marinicaulis sp.]